jgi:hypothetical protein
MHESKFAGLLRGSFQNLLSANLLVLLKTVELQAFGAPYIEIYLIKKNNKELSIKIFKRFLKKTSW